MKKFLEATLTMLANLIHGIIVIIGSIGLICLISFIDARSTIVITNDPHVRSDIECSLETNKSRMSSNKNIKMLHLKFGE